LTRTIEENLESQNFSQLDISEASRTLREFINGQLRQDVHILRDPNKPNSLQSTYSVLRDWEDRLNVAITEAQGKLSITIDPAANPLTVKKITSSDEIGAARGILTAITGSSSPLLSAYHLEFDSYTSGGTTSYTLNGAPLLAPDGSLTFISPDLHLDANYRRIVLPLGIANLYVAINAKGEMEVVRVSVDAAMSEDTLSPASSDNGALSMDPATSDEARAVGGIDLDAANMHMKLNRAGEGVQLHLPLGDTLTGDNGMIIEGGLTPVIINITPVTHFPLLLGERESPPEDRTLSSLDS
jgi:hypothetical protein